MVKETYQLEVCSETARVWLHNLGFAQKNHHQSVYFDGHEREDAVTYREEFLQKLEELDRRCVYDGHEPQLFADERPLIQVHHDESTFYANADQTFHWADDEVRILKQKSLGQAIMVSDFIERQLETTCDIYAKLYKCLYPPTKDEPGEERSVQDD